MTPTEQDKELREKLTKLISQDGWVDTLEVDVDGQVNELVALITADRKRVALEAKIEVCDKYLSFRAASDAEYEAIQWLDFQRDELHAELKQELEKL